MKHTDRSMVNAGLGRVVACLVDAKAHFAGIDWTDPDEVQSHEVRIMESADAKIREALSLLFPLWAYECLSKDDKELICCNWDSLTFIQETS